MKKLNLSLILLTFSTTAFAMPASEICWPENVLQMIADDHASGIEKCIKEEKIYINHRYEDYYNSTPLIAAASAGSTNVLKKLLQLGASVNIANDLGLTALHLAFTNEDEALTLKIVKSLVVAKADVNTASKKGLTPALIAVQSGFFATTSYLLSQGAEKNYDLYSRAAGKITKKDLLFLDTFPVYEFPLNNPPEEYYPAFFGAACNPDLSVLDYFERKGADFKKIHSGENLLSQATKCKDSLDVKMITYLLEQGLEVNLPESPLFTIIGMGHSASDLLFALGFGYERKLFEEERLPILRKLLESGANPNAQLEKNDHTLLTFLAGVMARLQGDYLGWAPDRSKDVKRYLPVVNLLLEFGADKSLPGKDRKTPLKTYQDTCNTSRKGCDASVIKLFTP